MNQRTDVAEVFGFLRWLHTVRNPQAIDDARLDCAFHAAERLHQSKLEGDTHPAGPVVIKLQPFAVDEVTSIRKLAVSKGWFEVPSGSFERLRMIDGATGNHLIVYDGKRGFTAVANVGHPAAQELLREWKKSRKAS